MPSASSSSSSAPGAGPAPPRRVSVAFLVLSAIGFAGFGPFSAVAFRERGLGMSKTSLDLFDKDPMDTAGKLVNMKGEDSRDEPQPGDRDYVG